VIHSDGRVSDVTVLNSPDERLDRYAQSAFEHWHFRPGMKNGNAVALEAVVTIPFRIRSSF
jgi:TonB family protein